MKKVCHITTLHPRYDVRIFHKECKSLASYYEVHLIVADGEGDEIKDNIHIHDIGLRQTSRIKRAVIDSQKALQKSFELDCQLYHFHDPELIRIGRKLKKKGKKVIYDTHEDLPRQIEGKPYLPNWIKPIVSYFVEWQENKAARKFDFICTATPFIKDRFLIINPNTIDINNYPMLDELDIRVNWKEKNEAVCYIGGLDKVRGIKELVKAFETLDNVRLNLAGSFSEKEFENEIKTLPAWKKIKFLGFLDRKDVIQTLKTSKAGIVTLHPIKNYLDALPVKMFEYMLAGIPVIASNFPLWKKIMKDNDCGITVDPLNPKEIKEAIEFLQSNPEKAEEMGKNGKKAVLEKYNWTIEKSKLINVYKEILEA